MKDECHNINVRLHFNLTTFVEIPLGDVQSYATDLLSATQSQHTNLCIEILKMTVAVAFQLDSSIDPVAILPKLAEALEQADALESWRPETRMPALTAWDEHVRDTIRFLVYLKFTQKDNSELDTFVEGLIAHVAILACQQFAIDMDVTSRPTNSVTRREEQFHKSLRSDEQLTPPLNYWAPTVQVASLDVFVEGLVHSLVRESEKSSEAGLWGIQTLIKSCISLVGNENYVTYLPISMFTSPTLLRILRYYLVFPSVS